MDICNENFTPTTSSISRLDSLIFGYLSRQQYTKTVSALLEESPVLKENGGRFGGGRGVFVQINPTVCDKNLEYIVETFAQYGRFDVPPEFIDFGHQLRCLANDFSRMTTVFGNARSENHRKMYGSRAKSRAQHTKVMRDSSNYTQPNPVNAAVFHIPHHPLTVDSPTPPQNPIYTGAQTQIGNSVDNQLNYQNQNHNVIISKDQESKDKSTLLSSAACNIPSFGEIDNNLNISGSNNLDPPMDTHNEDNDNHMHSILSDEGSSRRKRHQPHSFSERFISKLADAASRTKQCKEQHSTTTDLSTLDIGDEIFDFCDIRNLPSQLEEVVCRFDPEDRFFDYAGYIDIDENSQAPFESTSFSDTAMVEHVREPSPVKQTILPSIPPRKDTPFGLDNVNLSLMPQSTLSSEKNPVYNPRPYTMKGPRGPTKIQSKSLIERTGIKEAKVFEAKNIPLRNEKITMDSLFDDCDSSSSDGPEVRDNHKRSKSPEKSKKEGHRDEYRNKNKESHVKEKRPEKSNGHRDRKEERELDRKRHDKEEKIRSEDKHKSVRTEKSDRVEDKKKHERYRDDTEKREHERKKKEMVIRASREYEQQRRDDAMKKREEDRKRYHEERKKNVMPTKDEERKPREEVDGAVKDEDRRSRDKRKHLDDDTSSAEVDRNEREASQDSLMSSSYCYSFDPNAKKNRNSKENEKVSNSFKSKLWDNKTKDESTKKKRSKDVSGSSSMPDILWEIEKSFDSLRRNERSPSPDMSFMNMKKLAPSTRIPKKGSDLTLAAATSVAPSTIPSATPSQAHSAAPSTTPSAAPSAAPSPVPFNSITLAPERYSEPDSLPPHQPVVPHRTSHPIHAQQLPTVQTSECYIPTVSENQNDQNLTNLLKSPMVSGLPSNETNLLIKSTVNDARIGLQFENAALKWRQNIELEKESESRKRSSQHNVTLSQVFNGSSSPKDMNNKKIKLDLSVINSIMKKVHGNSSAD